jgi:hypothetical protein
MSDSIQAFFFGTSYGEVTDGKPVGLAGFAIPDLGISFRSRWTGSIHECQYAGLLALLRFIETNRKEFKGIDFEVLSDSALVVYQIANKKFISKDLLPFYHAAIEFKRKISYKVSWVPREENAAVTGLSDVPPLACDINLEFDLNKNNPGETDLRAQI